MKSSTSKKITVIPRPLTLGRTDIGTFTNPNDFAIRIMLQAPTLRIVLAGGIANKNPGCIPLKVERPKK